MDKLYPIIIQKFNCESIGHVTFAFSLLIWSKEYKNVASLCFSISWLISRRHLFVLFYRSVVAALTVAFG